MSMRVIGGLLAAAAVTATVGLLPVTSAQAATQYLTVLPAKGNLEVPIDLRVATGSYCPSDATRVIVRLTGPGLDAPFNLTGNTDIKALDDFSIPGTTIIPLIWGWREAGGNVEPQPVDFNGDYRITLSCLKGLSLESLGDTIADVHIDHAAASYVVTSPQPKVVDPQPAQTDVPSDPTGATQPSASPKPHPTGGSADPGTTPLTGPTGDGAAPSSGSAVAPAGGDPSQPPVDSQGQAQQPDPQAAPAAAPAAAQSSSGPSVPLTTIFTIAGLALLVSAGYGFMKARRKGSQS